MSSNSRAGLLIGRYISVLLSHSLSNQIIIRTCTIPDCDLPEFCISGDPIFPRSTLLNWGKRKHFVRSRMAD